MFANTVSHHSGAPAPYCKILQCRIIAAFVNITSYGNVILSMHNRVCIPTRPRAKSRRIALLLSARVA